MEANICQADSVPLLGELSLSLQSQPRAPYVASRAQVTSYCPQNVITHSGTSVAQFTIASSDQWCDPKSVCIAFTIRNTASTGQLEFLSTDMQVLFSRLQVTMGGTIVEDHVQHYNRLCTLFNKYQSTDKILEVSSMALGTPQTMGVADGVVKPQLFTVEDIKPQKIPAGESRRVVMRLTMSSVFNGSEKMDPYLRVKFGRVRVSHSRCGRKCG